uniref:C-type lectin domain-containing protein n=1 Tax=Ornithorhynchus anatinus TaxID=9258 RepID=A0A6I8PCS3_ORNAN
MQNEEGYEVLNIHTKPKISSQPLPVSPKETSTQRQCPADWKSDGGKCYWFSNVTDKKSWNESIEFCAEMKSNLTTIQEMCDLGFIWSQIPLSKYYWIGLNILHPGGNWTWLDGSALNVRLFQITRSPGKDTCGALSRDGIYPENCESLNPWICQQ